jgi:hypothetical protein
MRMHVVTLLGLIIIAVVVLAAVTTPDKDTPRT